MTDFDAKLNRRHRNDWRGQQIEVEVTDDGERILTIYIGRRDAYKRGDPSEYEVRIIDKTEHHHLETTIMELDSGHVRVVTDE